MWLSPMTMSAFVNEYRTIVDVFCIDLSKILALSSVIFISRVLRSAWLGKDQIWGSEGDLQVIIYLPVADGLPKASALGPVILNISTNN